MRLWSLTGQPTTTSLVAPARLLSNNGSKASTATPSKKQRWHSISTATRSARKDASDTAKLKGDRDNAYREWQERSAEVSGLKTVAESLRSGQANMAVNESAAKKAADLRAAAEVSLAKTQDELQSAQQRLNQLKADLSRYEQLRTTQAVDEAALQRISSARKEAETSLSLKRDELATAEKRLAVIQTELAGLEQRKRQVAIDETAARRAQEGRSEAEKSLSTIQDQIADLQQRRESTSAQLDNLRERSDENRRLQELCVRRLSPLIAACSSLASVGKVMAFGCTDWKTPV